MATIKEVAKKAGVSTATVSRVLNGNYPVSDEAEQKVLEAVKKLNYRMNAVAKSLKTNKTNTIALVTPSIDNEYVMNMASGIYNILDTNEYTLAVYFTNNDLQKEKAILKKLFENRTDGIIVYSFLDNRKTIKRYIDQGMKIVYVDGKAPDDLATSVIENNKEMSYKLADLAIKKGHKKISVLKGIPGSYTADERYEGFLKAVTDNGLTFEEKYVVDGYYMRGISHYNTKKMLQDNIDDLPTLIFSVNNHMTEGALIAIDELGLSVPDDISLISYGDITVPKLSKPALTVVQQNPIIIGEKAIATLLEIINSDEQIQAKNIVVESHIIERDSVKTI